MHTAMGHSENGIPSEYENDFLPRLWQSIQCSCILTYRVAFDRKLFVGCEDVKHLQGRKKKYHKQHASMSAAQRFRG